MGTLFNVEWATLAFPRTDCRDHRVGAGGHAAGRTLEARSGRPRSYSAAALGAHAEAHARHHACTCAHGTRKDGRVPEGGPTREPGEPSTRTQVPGSPAVGVATPGAWLPRRRSLGVAGGTAGGGARAKPRGGVRCWWGRGAGRWGRGAEARGAVPRALFARGPGCVPRNLLRLAYRAYLGLLFRHGCAATAAASAAGTGGTGAGESRSLPRRSPAATVAGPRFIPKSRRAGWPRGVTWSGACTRRVPRAAGARRPAAIPDGCECVTGRVRRPGARRAPGTRDSRSWTPETPDVGGSLRGHAGSREARED